MIVEDASRFARDLVTQELGIIALIGRGVRVVTANGDDLTETNDHMKVAMRQIAGTFAQLEKARLVAKLKAARDRKREETGKCGGRKSYAEARPATVALAKQLRGAPSVKFPKLWRRKAINGQGKAVRRLGGAGNAGPTLNVWRPTPRATAASLCATRQRAAEAVAADH